MIIELTITIFTTTIPIFTENYNRFHDMNYNKEKLLL